MNLVAVVSNRRAPLQVKNLHLDTASSCPQTESLQQIYGLFQTWTTGEVKSANDHFQQKQFRA